MNETILSRIINKPADEEFQPNEAIYAKLIPDDGLLLKHLMNNLETTKSFIRSLPGNKLQYSYAEGKWTIKEILIHLMDMERVYCYRALRFSRNDQTVLPGFNAEQYILYSGANDKNISDLLEELEAVRHSTVMFVYGLTDEALLRSGVMNDYAVSVRALVYHIAGHELHHINIIKERYL